MISYTDCSGSYKLFCSRIYSIEIKKIHSRFNTFIYVESNVCDLVGVAGFVDLAVEFFEEE